MKSKVELHRILAIDTSCDETSIAILENGKVMASVVASQAELQSKWGGVVPALAQQKHNEWLIMALSQALLSASRRSKSIRLDEESKAALKKIEKISKIGKIWEISKSSTLKEDTDRSTSTAPEIDRIVQSDLTDTQKQAKLESNKSYDIVKPNKIVNLYILEKIDNPGIELVTVTLGPGLAIALETGINLAKEISLHWGIPISRVNHMEGHLWSSLIRNSQGKNKYFSELSPEKITEIQTQSIGLLISGKHSEIIDLKKDFEYEKIVSTLDDAAGEAFDKFAGILGLGYPGGQTIDNLAKSEMTKKNLLVAIEEFPLPIPMKAKKDRYGNLNLRFSFSGLKTAAKYLHEKKTESKKLTKREIAMFAASFQYSIAESIIRKLDLSLEHIGVSKKYLLAGGGSIANSYIRRRLMEWGRINNIKVLIPEKKFLGDNAAMIGNIAYLKMKYQAKRAKIFNLTRSDASRTEANVELDRLPKWNIEQSNSEKLN